MSCNLNRDPTPRTGNGEMTKIEWTDETWNPIRGTKGRHHCTKVSPGCEHCYAERMNVRFGGPKYVAGADTFRLDVSALRKPYRWRKPRMVFPCSMTDLFHEDVPETLIFQMFGVMANTPMHTYQVLTKRPERALALIRTFRDAIEGRQDDGSVMIPWPLLNLWLGVTAENQEMADKRIPILLQIPAAVRFVSMEPLLSEIKLSRHHQHCPEHDFHSGFCSSPCPSLRSLDWVIVGGESGPGARPMKPEWLQKARDDCIAASVPFFFKQWGEWLGVWPIDPKPNAKERRWNGGISSYRVGKKNAGRLLGGREWNQMPGGR